jgi:hypothetical protein
MGYAGVTDFSNWQDANYSQAEQAIISTYNNSLLQCLGGGGE